MKKKIFLVLTLAFVLSLLLIISVNAEVTTYDDFNVNALENIEYRADDVIVFDDGFSCPSVYVFKDTKKIGEGNWGSPDGLKKVLDFTYINTKVAPKEYGFDDIDSIDIPQGVTEIGRYACHSLSTIRVVSIPDTVDNLGSAIFQKASGLEYCIMEHKETSGLTTLSGSLFSESGLKAFSMPDCITTLPSGYEFQNCKSMQAVYLSKNLTAISNSGACFDWCAKMYLVNEPFVAGSENEIPAKPSVYYFPSKLTTLGTAGVFRGSNSINDVLVFGTQLTAIKSRVAFQNCPANTVVFLGDMTEVVANETYYWGTKNFIFANPNDKSASDLDNLALKSDANAYFCYGDNASHLFEKSVSTDATCTAPKMTANYCFCGTIIGEPTTEGEALGHLLLDEDAYYTFTGFLVAGNKNIDCARGDCDHTEVTALESAIFTALGYSVKEYGVDGKCFTNGYKINNEALDLYESTMGVKVGFGFGFNRADRFATEGEVTLDSFTISGYAKRPENDREFGAVEYKMTYENSETLEQDIAKDIVIAFYVVEVNNETGAETLTFVNKGEGAYNGFEAISYLGAAELAK